MLALVPINLVPIVLQRNYEEFSQWGAGLNCGKITRWVDSKEKLFIFSLTFNFKEMFFYSNICLHNKTNLYQI